MFTCWHNILIIAIICCISNSVQRMTLAKLLLPQHVASGKRSIIYLKVLEGSLSLFFYFCEFLMLQDQMVSIIGRRSDGRAIGSKKKKATDLQRRFLCQSSHICKPVSAESRFSVSVKTHFLVLSHGFPSVLAAETRPEQLQGQRQSMWRVQTFYQEQLQRQTNRCKYINT